MEGNLLVPGKSWVKDRILDEETGLSKDVYEYEDSVRDVAEELKACMMRAESEMLSPLIDEPFPCGVDYNIGPVWIH
jgi:hypothetical protein